MLTQIESRRGIGSRIQSIFVQTSNVDDHGDAVKLKLLMAGSQRHTLRHLTVSRPHCVDVVYFHLRCGLAIGAGTPVTVRDRIRTVYHSTISIYLVFIHLTELAKVCIIFVQCVAIITYARINSHELHVQNFSS
jgi:hypothetical protein